MWRSRVLEIIVLLIVGIAAASHSANAYDPPAASKPLLARIDFVAARPVDEDYRSQFALCDAKDEFRGQVLTGWRRCSGDKNRVNALLRLADGSILYESKLGLDLDGSWIAWNDNGPADQRGTWYQWPRSCTAGERDSNGLCAREQVDAEHIPFAVIPIAGPSGLDREFRQKTGVDKGDFGVLIFRDRWTPVFVADGGPYNKLGEASAAALAALGEDRCRHRNEQGFCNKYQDVSIETGVLTILFPGSRRADVTAETIMSAACNIARQRLGLTGAPGCDP